MTKRCARCGATKAIDDFGWNAKASKHDCYCRPCRSDYHRQHYLANKQRYIDNAARRNRSEAEKRWAYLLEYFATHPCVDCGETDPLVLEFDHLGDKLFGIAHGLKYRRWQDVLDEMAKCDVVCANCHRRRTAHRGGFLRATLVRRQELAAEARISQ